LKDARDHSEFKNLDATQDLQLDRSNFTIDHRTIDSNHKGDRQADVAANYMSLGGTASTGGGSRPGSKV